MYALQIILLFFVYAFLGWCCEVVFAAVKLGRFVNRGFLNGPICPIYGFGVIGVFLIMRPVQDNLPLLYIGSAALTTAIELVTGWALEKLFHARWWDYSNMPMSIGGYVCVPFSLVWGLACLVIVKWLHPAFEGVVALFPNWLCITLDALFCSVFAFDLVTTVIAVRKLSDRLARLTEAAGELHAISDEIGQTLFDTTRMAREHVMDGAEAFRARSAGAKSQMEAAQSRIAAWLDQQRESASAATESIRARFDAAVRRASRALEERGFSHRRLLSAFPNLKSLRNQESLETLRAFYEKHRGGKS